MKVVIKDHNQKPRVENVDENDFRKIIGGYLEMVRLPEHPDISIWLDEEGKLKGLPANFLWLYDVIVGTVIFAGVKGEDLIDLTSKQIKIIQNYLKEQE